jgi:hypothetical protein
MNTFILVKKKHDHRNIFCFEWKIINCIYFFLIKDITLGSKRNITYFQVVITIILPYQKRVITIIFLVKVCFGQ